MKTLLLFLAFSSAAYGQILAPILQGAPVAAGPNTWAVVQHVKSGTNVCAGSTSCSLTVSATGSGNLLVLMTGEGSGGPAVIKQTGMTGGGTWVHNGGDSAGNCTSSGSAVDCAYVLSSVSGATTISWSTTSSSFHTAAEFYEVTPSSGTSTLDTVGANVNGFSTTPAGQTLTLSGSSDIILQGIQSLDNTCTAVTAGWVGDFRDDVGTHGAASKVNATVGTAPTWTCGNTQSAVNGIAFK